MTLPWPRHAEDRAEAATQRAPAPGPPASAPGLQLPGPGHGEAGDRGDGGGRARHHEGQDCGGSTQVEHQTRFAKISQSRRRLLLGLLLFESAH